jgi:hypothetical protein
MVTIQKDAKRRITMKKNVLVVVGIAGMLGIFQPDAQAELRLRLGDIRIDAGDRPAFVIDTRPDFIYLDDQGFSVSIDSPYDIIAYDDFYFLYRDGIWYRSSDYRGPWLVIREYDLPYNIRRHRWEDIRRYRDIEYRRHDRGYWDERYRLERERDRDRDRGRERFNDNRPGVNPDQRRNDNRSNNPDQRRNDNRSNNRDQRIDNRKGPDQPKAANVMKAPDQPKKDANIKKAPEQPRKDDNRKGSDHSKKDDQGNNQNPSR